MVVLLVVFLLVVVVVVVVLVVVVPLPLFDRCARRVDCSALCCLCLAALFLSFSSPHPRAPPPLLRPQLIRERTVQLSVSIASHCCSQSHPQAVHNKGEFFLPFAHTVSITNTLWFDAAESA
eukprot:COSAG02_NODE_12234_length_1576_cov_0.975626_2_plen_122_part_00